MSECQAYRVRFYRTLMQHSGQPCNSTVETIEIRRSRTEDRAVQAAIKRFVRHQRLTGWEWLATGYDVSQTAGDRHSQA